MTTWVIPIHSLPSPKPLRKTIGRADDRIAGQDAVRPGVCKGAEPARGGTNRTSPNKGDCRGVGASLGCREPYATVRTLPWPPGQLGRVSTLQRLAWHGDS
jgi:hypothetical protein